MKTIVRIFVAGLLFAVMGLPSVLGQSNNTRKLGEYYSKLGSLNVWTTEDVLRQKTGYYPEFRTMRFGKHPGFDRVVFEMDGDLIGYYVHYGEPPFQAEAGEEVVNVRGKAFVEIALYPVVSTDENIEANERLGARQNKVRMPLIREIKTVEWFEGELRHVIGLRKRKPFRVQVFSNPTRLVVDFKH
jgi:hypothetical protein